MSVLSYLKESLNEKDKWSKEVKVKQGKMHKLLNIPADKRIKDVYTSGEKLAKDLIKALNGNQSKAASMISYSANIDPDDNVLDKALRAMKKIDTKKEKEKKTVKEGLNEEVDYVTLKFKNDPPFFSMTTRGEVDADLYRGGVKAIELGEVDNKKYLTIKIKKDDLEKAKKLIRYKYTVSED